MSENPTDPPTPTPTTPAGPATTGAAGRRTASAGRRRVDVLVALAIVLPAVAVVAFGVIGGQDDPLAGPQAPATSPLTSATLVCPAAPTARGGPVRVTRAPGVPGGELGVATAPYLPDATQDATTTPGDPIAVAPRSSGVVPGSRGATVLDGTGSAAPGIIAGRGDRLAVPECRGPSYDEWLVGIGASARYDTVLEVVNPDDGDAVVDLELHGRTGIVEEPALRGIQVPGHGVRRIDLGAVAPRSGATSAHLTVIRGRVTATARNTYDPLGRGRVTTDYLPADPEPADERLILGVPARPNSATLFLTNPGADEIRVTPRLVTGEAVFTPTDSTAVAVAPNATVAVQLRGVLARETAQGVIGVQVEATGPVAASLRVLTRDDDLVLLAPAPALADPTAAVVPTGAKTLQLGGAIRAGVVHVVSYDARGEELADERVEVGPDRAATLALPPRAVVVTVEARNTRISGLVSIPVGGRQPGLATLRLRAPDLQARIPAVGPQ